MKKSWIVLLAIFALSLVIAAGVLAQDATTPSDMTGTVRVGTWDTGVGLEVWDTVINHFKEAYPNVDVQFEPVPQDYGTKLLAQFASGTAPDVFQVGDGDAATYQSMGVVANLDPFIAGDNGFDINSLYPGIAAFGQMQGGTYYLTKDYSPLVLYYNKDMFDAAGVAYPTADWKWEDFQAAAQKLTLDANGKDATASDFDASNIQRWGVWMPNSWGDTAWERGILPIIYQNGGSEVSDDGMTTAGHMNSEANVQALQWYTDLFKKYHVAVSKTDYASFAGADLFSTQQVAMMWTGSWPMNSYESGDSALTFNWGTNILPAGPKGNANALCWAGFALNANSANQDAAWAFLKYIAVGDGAKDFADYALTDVIAIAEAQGLDTDEYKGSVIADLANVQQIPELKTPYWAACGFKYFTEGISTVLEGDAEVQAAMDNAASQADACLAEKNAAS